MPDMLTLQEACKLVPSFSAVDGAYLQPLVSAANAIAEQYCNREFYTARSFTKYYNLPPPGSRNEIPLGDRPVNSITSVNVDPRGGFGQLTATFGSDTLLTAGEAYYYEPGSDILVLLTCQSNWPAYGSFGGYGGWWGNYGYPFGINRRGAATGVVKVVYNAGYESFPTDLLSAIAQVVSFMYGSAMETGGGRVVQYIDTSVASTGAIDALSYGNVPALGSARAIFNTYRESAVPAPKW